MSKNDYYTSTVSGARAHAERHAEPDYDDDRPTKADCDREAAHERWLEEEMASIVSDLESISDRLNEADQDEAADRLDGFINRLP